MKLMYGYTLFITHDPYGGECGEEETMLYETAEERDETVDMLVDELCKTYDMVNENYRPFHKWDLYDSDGNIRGMIIMFHKMEEGS